MVTIAETNPSASIQQKQRRMSWRLIERFQTLEPAQRLIQRMESEGQPCRLLMIDCLAVIALSAPPSVAH